MHRPGNAASLDLNPLMRLKDALEGAQSNTSKMLQRLERFENRLTELDEKMRPIQVATKHYTRAKENISLTLVEVGKTYEYFRVANEVREVIKAGLHTESQEEFFAALNRLLGAKRFFQTHLEIKSSSQALASTNELLNTALASCMEEFERLLRDSGKTIHFQEGQYSIVNPLTQDSAGDVKAICTVLSGHEDRALFDVYQSVRISKLKSELKEHEASKSKEWHAAARDGPYEKGSHPFRDYFQLAYWLLRSELNLWGSTLPSTSESLKVFVAICDAVIGELDRVLMPLLSDDFSRAYSNPVVKRSKMLLVRLDVLETLTDLYEEFRDLCKPDARNESSASTGLSRMRQDVVNASASLVESLSSESIRAGFTYVDISRKVAVGAAGSDAALLNDSSACDLHPAAGNIMYCCSEMREYSASYRRMRELLGSFFPGSESSKFGQSDIPTIDVSCVPADTETFVIRVLDTLLGALEDRAAMWDQKDKGSMKRSLASTNHNLYDAEDKCAEDIILGARKHLFMCNNLLSVSNHVKEMMKEVEPSTSSKNQSSKLMPGSSKSGMGSVKGSVKVRHKLSPFSLMVDAKLEEAQVEFCELVAVALALDEESMTDFESQFQKNKGEQNRLLKLKFSVFNTGMDAFLAQQGDWRISNALLRDKLSARLVTRVQPPYAAFYAKYSVIKFSKKHTNEYLKYPPAVTERHLGGFFGRA